jgi:TonB-dependent receptor
LRAQWLTTCATALFLALPTVSNAQNSGGDESGIETVTVTAQRYREQALHLKAAAPNVIEVQPVQEIRQLPDVNVGEALQRMPGISMESDTGEGRFINIRGMDADLNGTTFDGVRLTASNQSTPQSGGRAVAFDAFPTGIIGGVEIVKSLTPDMDAEGLGGVINLEPRTLPASRESFLDAGVGAGYEPLRDRPVWQDDITAGTTLDTAGNIGNGGPFGVVGSYAIEDDHRGVDDIEEGYSLDPLPFGTSGAKLLNNLQYRWYEYHRIRQGIGGTLSYTPNDQNAFFVRIIHAGYTEYADKHHLELQNLDAGPCSDGNPPSSTNNYCFNPGSKSFSATSAEPVQTFTDSDEHVGNDLILFGGHSQFGALHADYRGAWTRGHDDFVWNFSGVFATPNFVPLSINNVKSAAFPTFNSPVNLANPALYQFGTDNNNSNSNVNSYSSLQNAPSISNDQEWSGAVDFTLPLVFGDNDGRFKFGASVRLRSRNVAMSQLTYNLPNVVSLSGLTVGPDIVYYDNHYNIGPNLNYSAIEHLPGLFLSDPAGDALANGQALEHDTENVFAGYLQYTAAYGPLSFIGGVRFEATNGAYHANLATTDASGNTVLTPNTNKQDYTNFFPSAQAKYQLDDDTQARLAVSSAIARPGFNQITAAKSIDYSNLPNISITEGDPSVKATTGTSVDLTLEHYLPNGGLAYGGLFYKYFNNYIVPTISVVNNNTGGQTTTTSFADIGAAFAEGIELNYIQQFAFLPDPMDGLGFDGNLTYNYARGDIRPGERHTLPQTSPFNYNAELFYEKGPVGIRLAASYVSMNLWAVGGDSTQDNYSQPRFRLDLGATYDITDNVQFYFQVKNLTNTLLEFTQTRSLNFPIQREFYGPTYFTGVRVQIGQGGFTHLNSEGDDD